MENENKKKILVITDRPKRWNNSIYDVITLLDMTNEFQNRDETDNAKIFEEEKKIKKEETELEIKNLEEERKQLQGELSTIVKDINGLRKQIIQQKKEKKNGIEEIKKQDEIKKEINDMIKKQDEIKVEIEEINKNINDKRKNKTEIEQKIANLENEIKNMDRARPDDINRKKNELDFLKANKKKEDEDKKKRDEEEDLKKYKSVRKNQFNNIVIIDDSITNADIEMFTKISKIDFFEEIRDKYIDKNAYAMLVKPMNIYLEKPEWYKKGVFRFLKNKVYDIYSNKKEFELNVFFKNNKDVTEFRRQMQNALPSNNFEQNYQLFKEKKFNEANQKDIEIKTEVIHSVKEYDIFINNRNKFTAYVNTPIHNRNLNQKIQEASNHKYSKDILEKMKKDYGHTTDNSNKFPYTTDKPLNIYYIIALHNNLTLDPSYHMMKTEIANNIGIFNTTYMKGSIIQSASFTEIPQYDPVELFKTDTDRYFMWMKAESGEGEIGKKFLGKKIYESHMQTFKDIMNNLKAKKNNRMQQKGGNKTFKQIKVSKKQNKTKQNLKKYKMKTVCSLQL